MTQKSTQTFQAAYNHLTAMFWPDTCSCKSTTSVTACHKRFQMANLLSTYTPTGRQKPVSVVGWP